MTAATYIRDVALHPDGRTACVTGREPGVGAAIKTVATRTRAVARTVKLGGFLTRLTLSGNGDRAVESRDGERFYVKGLQEFR